MNIVLLEPEIPHNTGNIGRSCVATDTTLHLIKPLGFSTEDKQLKRSGLDYWQDLDVRFYENFDDFMAQNESCCLFMATTKARKIYTEVCYPKDCFIMFGKESAGIPEELLLNNQENCIRIPMYLEYRSLNLSNSVSIILFEALRQHQFQGLNLAGELHRHQWQD